MRTLALRQVYYGWWIVAGFAAINVYWYGLLAAGLTVFFTPIRHSFGWSAALLAAIFSLLNVGSGVCAPLVGLVFDRYGPRGLMFAAAAFGGGGLILVSQARSLPAFVGAFLLVAVGFGIWASGTGPAAAGLWFERHRGLASGIIIGSSGLGGLLVPVWQALVDALGWRTTLAISGLLLWVVSFPAAALLRHRPEQMGLLPDGALPGEHWAATVHRPAAPEAGFARAMRSWQFWTLCCACTLLLMGVTGATLLLLQRLHDEAHLPADRAVAAATIVTLLSLIGKPGCGWLADRFSPIALAAIMAALQAIGLLALGTAPEKMLLLVVFVLTFGLANDNPRLMASLILMRYYGLRAFGRIQGVLYVTLLAGRVAGPVIAGALHDAGHGYASAFLLYAAVSFATLPLFFILRPPAPAPVAEIIPAGGDA